MKLFVSWIISAVGSVAAWCPAHGQIFGGVSDTGTVYLSNTQGADAPTLIVAALPVAIRDSARVVSAHAPMPDELASNVFLPFIYEASSAYRLPVALIHAVIAVESNYNPRAVSPKGAQGLMQLMPATARRFGGGDAFDPRQNILTGSRYLRWLMDQFNQNMELTVAAYNAGEGAVVKAGYRIPPYTETMKYVPNVLAHYQRALRIS
ncbi:MAG: lytic transglycosylase domain-containing protein [Burkholderiaceae bacterium]|nr:lytic transglycosylase domain-containing protein [Burkholderiaceae bacterium]